MLKLFDLFFNPIETEKKPYLLTLIGFFYASLSLLLSLWLFPEYASLVMIFLTTFASLFLFQKALMLEERKEKDISSEKYLLKEHSKILVLFIYLFIGFLAAFLLWTIILPQTLMTQTFSLQQDTIKEILSITGSSTSSDNLTLILKNNFRVLALSLLFAIFYGAGALFILAWNASIMGYVIGYLAKSSLGLSHLPIIITRYAIHGLIEMSAYFVGALAGGILFIAILKKDLRKYRLKRTLIDSLALILIASILLLIAGLIEVYISPFIS